MRSMRYMRSNRFTRCESQGRRRGAAAVEFAMIAPVFLLLLGGIIEFGQAFRMQHTLSAAARQGARAAITDGATSSVVAQKVRDQCVKNLGVAATDVGVSISVNGAGGAEVATAGSGSEISVTVSIPFSKAAAGFFTGLFSSSSLRSTCTYERE